MSTEIALTRPEPAMDHQSLKTLMDQAIRYVDSGLLPASIKTPQQALIIMAQGRELGIPATVALRGIVVVQGKPTCSAELMMALVHRTYGQSAMRVFKTDNEACTVQYRQQGWDGVSEYTFTIEDARRANLLKNPTWNMYPAAMLRARAISAVVRFAFPECISGVYTPDELDAPVSIVDGEVVPDADALATPPPTSEWSPTLEQKWASGLKLANQTGAEIPTKPPADATRNEIVAALRELAENCAQAQRKRDRDELEATLRDVVSAAVAAGSESYSMPDRLDVLSDDDLRQMIAKIQQAIPDGDFEELPA